MTAQPRVPAGRAGGGRFATAECPRVYALLDALAEDAPPPQPTADNPVVELRPGCWAVYAPRCPHGHFARWAAANCRPCARGR